MVINNASQKGLLSDKCSFILIYNIYVVHVSVLKYIL